MSIVKCTECGQIFNGNDGWCPKCGFPAEKCTPVNNMASAAVPPAIPTTSGNVVMKTGDKDEEMISLYANIVFYIAIAWAAITFLGGMIAISGYGISGSTKAIVFFTTLIESGCIVFLGFVLRSFLNIYVKISKNLREINQKTK